MQNLSSQNRDRIALEGRFLPPGEVSCYSLFFFFSMPHLFGARGIGKQRGSPGGDRSGGGGEGGMGAGGRRDNGTLSFPKEGGFEWVQRDGVGGLQSRLEGDSIQSLVEELGLEISIQTGEMSGNSHSW